MSGGLRKLTRNDVQIPLSTARDRRLGFKERGLLTYILSLPEGTHVTIDLLVKASDHDGPTAVASGLKRLREHGYYRVERRRELDGTFSTGSSASAWPVPEWIDDDRAFGGKIVSLVRQQDGSFRVHRPDGRITGDGFAEAGTASPQVTPKPGFPGSGSPNPGEPNPENPSTKDFSPTERSTKNKTSPCPTPPASDEDSHDDAGPARPDVDRLCALLADLVAENGSKRPTITKAWRVEARRMLDLDRRDPVKAENLIRWCQADSFWRANVRSMVKFRAQYDQLRLRALAEHAAQNRAGGNGGPNRVVEMNNASLHLAEQPRGARLGIEGLR